MVVGWRLFTWTIGGYKNCKPGSVAGVWWVHFVGPAVLLQAAVVLQS